MQTLPYLAIVAGLPSSRRTLHAVAKKSNATRTPETLAQLPPLLSLRNCIAATTGPLFRSGESLYCTVLYCTATMPAYCILIGVYCTVVVRHGCTVRDQDHGLPSTVRSVTVCTGLSLCQATVQSVCKVLHGHHYGASQYWHATRFWTMTISGTPQYSRCELYSRCVLSWTATLSDYPLHSGCVLYSTASHNEKHCPSRPSVRPCVHSSVLVYVCRSESQSVGADGAQEEFGVVHMLLVRRSCSFCSFHCRH